MMVYFIHAPPSYRTKQPLERDPDSKRLVAEKLQKVINRGYVDRDQIIASLTSFFYVPKGEDDIRMVYDGTKCGLNGSVWIPSFFMPTLSSHLRAVEEGTHMGDVDIGEMFLNFMLHPSLRVLCGIDITPYALDMQEIPSSEKSPQDKTWVSWNRIAMGLKWSPYQAVKCVHFAEETIRGNRHDPSNVFSWDFVRLNLPGSKDYDPSLPWVSKVKLTEDALLEIAADLFTFVDDLRPTGSSNVKAWKACHKAASTLNWLGMQDAPRKRRDSRKDPGAWAGCVLRTEGGVFALVSDEKWNKLKSQIQELEGLLLDSSQSLPRKRLEQIRGFMNYVAQTYKYMIPYLNGLHLTIDGWREGRDSEGWRLTPTQIRDQHALTSEAPYLGDKYSCDSDPSPSLQTKKVQTDTGPAPIPTLVEAVPRLFEDVAALKRLTQEISPPWRRVRPKHCATVMYGFGDASGPAFGASSEVMGRTGTHFEYGQWISTVTEEESSNWREFTNLVEYLEGRELTGDLRDSEVFMFTDNSTAEAAFWKGNSKSRKLTDLVLRLREIEMRSGMMLHVIHVSGKRMIYQGTDGLSRGDHSSGVMSGRSMLSFVPLHLTATERSASLKPWLEFILQDLSPTFLEPDGWFDGVDRPVNFVWIPPPAAADVITERLAISKHKRPSSLHIVIAPRLMTGRWRKQLIKTTDFYCRLTCPSIWNLEEQFEPLLMFVSLPFLPHRPEFASKANVVERFRRSLLQDKLQEVHTKAQRNLLRQLFIDSRAICPL